MSNDKYKMFKNFMFNELGITKEDIRAWVTDAVKEEARKIVEHTYEEFDVERCMRESITSPYSNTRRDIVDRAARLLLQQFDLTIVKHEAK